jgi:hypothetical protein
MNRALAESGLVDVAAITYMRTNYGRGKKFSESLYTTTFLLYNTNPGAILRLFPRQPGAGETVVVMELVGRLAKMGAEVIKVAQAPNGDPARLVPGRHVSE